MVSIFYFLFFCLFLFCLFVCLFFFENKFKFRVVKTIRFCSNFTSMWYKHFLNIGWRDFRLPMSTLATVARNSNYDDNINIKNGFFRSGSKLPLLMLTMEVQCLSIHYLVSIWITCWRYLNRVVLSELYKI